MRLFMCLSKFLCNVLILFILVFFVAAQESKVTEKRGAESKEIVVEGIGSGTTRQDALHDAMRKAIEKAVGMYVISKTTLQDQELKEQIIVTSDALVTNYEEIERFEHNGIWVIKIRARVLPNEYLKYAPKLNPQKISETEIANLANQINTFRNSEDAIKDVFDETIYARLLPIKKESMEIGSSIDLSKDNVPLKVNFSASVDQTEFDKFQKRLSSILDTVSLQKTKVIFNDADFENWHTEYDIKKKIFSLQDNLLDKAGHSKKDDQFSFVALRNYKNGKLYYSLYLVPDKIKNIIIDSVRGSYYFAISVELSDSRVLRKTHYESILYFGYMDFGQNGESRLQRPLTFCNKMRLEEKNFENFSIERSGTPMKGSFTFDISTNDLKTVQSVFIFLLKKESEDITDDLKSIEEKLWK